MSARHPPLRRVHPLRFALCALAAGLLLGACTPSRNLVRDGNQLIAEGRVEEGLTELERATRERPDDLQARMSLVRQRDSHLGTLLSRVEADRAAGRLDEAGALLQR
ncbi:MAG: hypothetical protein AB9M60_08300, partial [Leptothrix sp. (in: b-proteobacteria)]